MYTFCYLYFFSVHFAWTSASCFYSVNCVSKSLITEADMIHEAEVMWQEIDPFTSNEPVIDSFHRFVSKSRLLNAQTILEEDFSTNQLKVYHFIKHIVFKWTEYLDELQSFWLSNKELLTEADMTDYKSSHVSYYVPANDVDISRKRSFAVIAEFLNTSVAIQKRRSWMKNTDLTCALNAIFQSELVYGINIDDLLEGRLKEFKSEPLKTKDIRMIAEFAFKSEQSIDKAKHWAEKWLTLIDRQRITTAKIRYANWMAGRGEPQTALAILKNINNTNSDLKLTEMIAHLEAECLHGTCREQFTLRDVNSVIRKQYESLCNETKYIGSDQQSSYLLKCYFQRTQIPYYFGLVEEVSRNPEIKLYHKVISEEEIEDIIATVSPHMKDAGILGKIENELYTVRQADSAWVTPYRSATCLALLERIELLTGLSTKCKPDRMYHSEGLQVANYGPGGMYESHYDTKIGYATSDDTGFVNGNLKNGGERIATWMFYLSEVDYGGRTVFPKLNVSIPVRKGSAVFWPNLLRSGLGDDRTLHAGCPVLHGSKWVGNVWMREDGQMFRRPCTRNPNE